MDHAGNSNGFKYVLAGSIGALLGGIFVLVASKAIPRMMSRAMSGMMSNMMGAIGEEGCTPGEF